MKTPLFSLSRAICWSLILGSLFYSNASASGQASEVAVFYDVNELPDRSVLQVKRFEVEQEGLHSFYPLYVKLLKQSEEKDVDALVVAEEKKTLRVIKEPVSYDSETGEVTSYEVREALFFELRAVGYRYIEEGDHMDRVVKKTVIHQFEPSSGEYQPVATVHYATTGKYVSHEGDQSAVTYLREFSANHLVAEGKHWKTWRNSEELLMRRWFNPDGPDKRCKVWEDLEGRVARIDIKTLGIRRSEQIVYNYSSEGLVSTRQLLTRKLGALEEHFLYDGLNRVSTRYVRTKKGQPVFRIEHEYYNNEEVAKSAKQ